MWQTLKDRIWSDAAIPPGKMLTADDFSIEDSTLRMGIHEIDIYNITCIFANEDTTPGDTIGGSLVIQTYNRGSKASEYYKSTFDKASVERINTLLQQIEEQIGKEHNFVIRHAMNNTDFQTDFFRLGL